MVDVMFEFKCIKHAMLDSETFRDIALLKDQHWIHGEVSQKKWIQDNIGDQDVHCLLYLVEAGKLILVGYLSVVIIHAKYDGRECEIYGIGNVCVDKKHEHQGFGRILLKNVNQYIRDHNMSAVLLCKKHVEGFYRKCNWKPLKNVDTYIGKIHNRDVVMYYNIAARFMPHATLILNKPF